MVFDPDFGVGGTPTPLLLRGETGVPLNRAGEG
jgi:hypothetical protein